MLNPFLACGRSLCYSTLASLLHRFNERRGLQSDTCLASKSNTCLGRDHNVAIISNDLKRAIYIYIYSIYGMGSFDSTSITYVELPKEYNVVKIRVEKSCDDVPIIFCLTFVLVSIVCRCVIYLLVTQLIVNPSGTFKKRLSRQFKHAQIWWSN